MDGDTPVVTRAADLAAANGVLVVNSAGNEGNGSWRYVVAPADGDSVLAVGAVLGNGLRASFSSVGPTSDGRVKPDVMAQGQDDYAASSLGPHGYDFVSGTSFSAPLAAGLAALLLEAHPEWTPWDVIAALRGTATRAGHPDNQYGYGICRGAAAVQWMPAVVAERSSTAIRLVCPNPFRPGDAIRFPTDLGAASEVKIFDALGRLVLSSSTGPGSDGWRWDGTDRGGRPMAPGVYFVRGPGMEAQGAHKIVLVR
jgi:subtilisin family serine protease